MSTILDSLKKSSDQRDDNEKTSIDNFNFGDSHSSKRKSSFLPVLLLLLVTAAILYWGYNYLNLGESPEADDSTTELSTNVKQKHEGLEQKTQQPEIAKETNNKKDKPNSNEVKQRIKDIKEKRSKQTKERKDQSLASLNRKQVKPIDTKSEEKKRKEKKEPMLKLTLPKDKQNNAQAIKPVKQEQPKPEVKTQLYKYIYQLPFTIRKEIPKLTLNIHVFDENPENRIAIINGERFMVDDMIEEQVLIKDIVQEGVLLEFNNQQFLIPKL